MAQSHSNTDLAKLRDFKVLTFDCYGTLIDWETGIIAAFKEIGIVDEDIQRLLARFAAVEHRVQEAEPGLVYPEVLAKCAEAVSTQYNITLNDNLKRQFGDSIKDWPPFPDTSAALKRLQKHYKLVILSNVDRKSFSNSENNMDVKFDLVCTAQDIGTYKPSLNNFDYVLSKVKDHFGAEKAATLHVFQSLFHDAVPATAVGMATTHIDRRFGVEGAGATPLPSAPYKLDYYFHKLADFADAVDAAFSTPSN